MRPIGEIKLGDEVLSFAEWKGKGKSGKMDRRLTYEKVTDVYTSYKAQTIVRLTLDDGQTLTATEGHPFKTADGWRDAIMLKKGGKLLLKGGDGDADAERTATIAEVRTEQRTLPVYTLEVANGHTYFVGVDGELVHNGSCTIPKNAIAGRGREARVQSKLQNKFKNASVQREQYLRNVDGTIARDSSGHARRIDHVVIEDGKARAYIETTSKTADKRDQLAKQIEIMRNGGTFVRDRTTGGLVDLSNSPFRLIRIR